MEIKDLLEVLETRITNIKKENRTHFNEGRIYELELTVGVVKSLLFGVGRSLPSDYDIGLMSDYGGGNVEWWQDYLKEEVARCNNYWISQLQDEEL